METGKEKSSEMEERQIVIFSLGDEEFGVDINEVREIIHVEQITHVPNAKPYIEGVINLRGGIIVVIDLSMKLGLKSKEIDKNTKIIVIDVGNNILGMVVDSATEVLRLSSDKIEPAPAIITKKINADYIKGVGILKERLLILLDLVKVMEEKEIEESEQIQGKYENISNNQSEEQAKKESTDEKKETSDKEPDKEPDKPVKEPVKEPDKEPDDNPPKKSDPDEKHPVHKNVHEDQYFFTHDKKPLKNVPELIKYLNGINEKTFKNYVNDEKNDFSEWLKHAVKDKELADDIVKIKSKKELTKTIMNRFLSANK